MLEKRNNFKSEKIFSDAKSSRTKTAIIVLAIAIVMLTGSASAYFYAEDHVKNEWSIGNVDIELIEPMYDESDKENITPKQEVPKDPQIENTGSNAAYVFMKVDIPKSDFAVVGEPAPYEQEVFDYTIDENWLEIACVEDNPYYNEHYYAYVDGAACKELPANETTPSVFKDGMITFKNARAGSFAGESHFEMNIRAFAVQTNNITDLNTTDPEEILRELIMTEIEYD